MSETKHTTEIEEKLKALEDISGLLDDLTPEQKKRFDDVVSRHGVKCELNTSEPDEELLVWFNHSFIEDDWHPDDIEKANKIRSLLQSNKVESRQSVKHKPVVTMEEIRRCVNIIQNCGSPRPCETCVNNLADLLKFKGMEVRG